MEFINQTVAVCLCTRPRARSWAGSGVDCVMSTAMRRIGIAVAILATTLYSSALAQSLRPSYSPDGTSESREASTPPTQRSIVHGSNPAPRQLAAKPRNAAAQLPRTQAKTQPKTQTQVQSQAQVQALPQIALQPQPATPNRGVHDFFAAIFCRADHVCCFASGRAAIWDVAS